jgi:hypothetical protein
LWDPPWGGPPIAALLGQASAHGEEQVT